jgi:hypothetical protein
MLKTLRFLIFVLVPWFQRFIFIIFIAKGRGKINLWNQGIVLADSIQTDRSMYKCEWNQNLLLEIIINNSKDFQT